MLISLRWQRVGYRRRAPRPGPGEGGAVPSLQAVVPTAGNSAHGRDLGGFRGGM